MKNHFTKDSWTWSLICHIVWFNAIDMFLQMPQCHTEKRTCQKTGMMWSCCVAWCEHLGPEKFGTASVREDGLLGTYLGQQRIGHGSFYAPSMVWTKVMRYSIPAIQKKQPKMCGRHGFLSPVHCENTWMGKVRWLTRRIMYVTCHAAIAHRSCLL